MAELAYALALEASGATLESSNLSPSTMVVYFTKYANDKFDILKRHGFVVSKSQVEDALKNPDAIDESRAPLYFAQKSLDKKRVLKVVYKKEAGAIKVITFYPGVNYEQE